MASVRISRAQWIALGEIIEWEADPTTGEYLPASSGLVHTGTVVALLDRNLLGFVRNEGGGVVGHQVTAAGQRAYVEYTSKYQTAANG